MNFFKKGQVIKVNFQEISKNANKYYSHEQIKRFIGNKKYYFIEYHPFSYDVGYISLTINRDGTCLNSFPVLIKDITLPDDGIKCRSELNRSLI